MKKLILSTLAVVTLMLTTQMNSQTKQGLFFSLNTGYNFGTSNQVGVLENSSQISGSDYKTDNVETSFGKGLNIGGAIGYMFNKNVGAELGINYLIGGKATGTKTQLSGEIKEESYNAKMLQFKPTLIISAGMEKINPYAKFGFLIGSGSINFENNTTFGSDRFYSKLIYDGGTALGFHAGIGLNYTINDKISLFGELNMVNMSYAPTKGKVTESNRNGVSNLTNETVRETEAEFVDSLNETEITPSTSPSKILKTNYAFGSFGFNFGVKYSL